MDELEAIYRRHSVREFNNQALRPDDEGRLREAAERASKASGLSFHVVCDERKAFAAGLISYGRLKGVANYLCVAGPRGAEAQELCGYYGEGLVLLAEAMGIKSCWVGLNYSKRHVRVALAPSERLIIAVALGYSEASGKPHRSRAFHEVATVETAEMPGWFSRGVDAALLAPTAINQQKFHLRLTDRLGQGGRPVVELTCGRGPYAHVDLGIVRCHFELAAGEDNFVWA